MAKPGPGSEIVLMPDERVLAAHAAREMPSIANMNVTNSRKVHVGPKFVSVNQTVQNKEMIKGQILGLELVSSETSRRLRCSVAVFLCWAFLVSSGLAFYLFYLALYKQETRLDIDLPLPKYIWSVVKNTSKVERLACLVAIAAMAIFIFLVVYYTMQAKKTGPEVVDVAPHEWNISREMWLAREHNNTETWVEYQPLKLVIIGHTVSSECYLFVRCAAELRNMQSYFLDHNGHDIPYNFIIGNDGRLYEGLGWNKEGAHTKSYNRCSLGVAFIGDYRAELKVHTRVTQAQLNVAQKLFQEGVRLGHLDPNYAVIGARDVSTSLAESPGSDLYNAIRKWDSYGHDNSQFRNRTCAQIYGLE